MQDVIGGGCAVVAFAQQVAGFGIWRQAGSGKGHATVSAADFRIAGTGADILCGEGLTLAA